MKSKKPVQKDTQKQIKKLAKKVNDSFYRLEKKGLEKSSNIYQATVKKAAKGDSRYSRSGARPRVTGSAASFETEAEAKKYQRYLESILTSKSRNISQIKQAKESRKEKIKATTTAKRERKQAERLAASVLGTPQPAYDPTERLKQEIQARVKKVNDSLYRLEKAGLQDESREYQMIEHYALDKDRGYVKGSPNFDKEGKYYNVDLDKGIIRATSDLSRFKDAQDLYRYNEVLKNILEAQTRTVSGTNQASKKAYDTFMQSETHKARPEMTHDQFRNIFKIYRTKVNPDRKDKAGSDTVIEMIRNTNLYAMDDDEIEAALKYEFEDTQELQKIKFDEVQGIYVFIK